MGRVERFRPRSLLDLRTPRDPAITSAVLIIAGSVAPDQRSLVTSVTVLHDDGTGRSLLRPKGLHITSASPSHINNLSTSFLVVVSCKIARIHPSTHDQFPRNSLYIGTFPISKACYYQPCLIQIPMPKENLQNCNRGNFHPAKFEYVYVTI